MQWNATLYDQQHAFVSKYGEGLLEVLQPKAGEKILDLGCGTGDLAHQMALSGCEVTGIDASQEMINKAKAKYPDVVFKCRDATHFDLRQKPSSAGATTGKFDAILSNAVLHWIKTPEKVLECVSIHLKKGGRFVAEFGAEGNVLKIRTAIHDVLKEYGYNQQAALEKWYFPSVAGYAALLEKHAFEIRFIESYERPTVLKSSESGIIEWLKMFAGSFFQDIPEEKKQEMLLAIQDRLYDKLYENGEWIADYKRLRFWAIKN